MIDPSSERQPVAGRAAVTGREIGRATTRAGITLAFERVWPALMPLAAVAAVFLAVSWFGVWPMLAPPVRAGLLVVFAVLAVAALWPVTGIRLPRRSDALRRVETRSGLAHRPLTALQDRLAGDATDDATALLWEAHRRRSQAAIGRLSSGAPEPRMAERDPFALRAALLLVLVVAFLWAGPDRGGRILAAFAPLGGVEAQPVRIDAWISPPAYTNRPPLLLTADGAAGSAAYHATGATQSVPQGSRLLVRGPRSADLEVLAAFADGEEHPVEVANPDAAPSVPAEFALDIAESGTVSVALDGREVLAWTFDVIEDTPPLISWAREPESTLSGALRLTYTLEDDHGVVSAEARFEPVDEAWRSANALIGPPDVALTLPQPRARSGAARTVREFTSHPWAGTRVRVRLHAFDDPGQEGTSEVAEIVLPERTFNNPLSRAIAEQRRTLALDREARRRVALALNALVQEPERHMEGAIGPYLGLRSVYWRLLHRDDDEALHSVLDQLWQIALELEDGALSLAAQALRDAQDRLARALERGAPDDEIEELMAQLREAMDAFLMELALRSLDEDDMSYMPYNPNARMVTPRDFERMLDAIENFARGGARDQAQQLLSDLRNLLDSLSSGGPMQGDMQSGPLGEMLDELGDMVRRQQRLMDETFDLDRQMQDPGGEEGEHGRAGELGRQQGDLREALRDLLDRLEQMGIDPSGELGQAGQAMGEAEGSLGEGNTGQALDRQGLALENLRRGGQALAESMMPQPGAGEGSAGGPGGPGQRETDPLGRPLRSDGPDFGLSVEVPDEIDAQRARRILEELRRRLSDPLRPPVERDYLERLLERF